MNYTENFKKVLELNTFIGTGNPNSKILIVGKEVATNIESDNPLEKQNSISTINNVSDWKNNVLNNTSQDQIKPWNYDESLSLDMVDNNPLFAFKSSIKKYTSDTWKKYQKLHDIIFKGEIDRNNDLPLNFQENFFITEMSVLPSKTTGKAQKHKEFKTKLQHRKDNFFKSEFIQDFPVVILACQNYIQNNGKIREIDDIFNVSFQKEKGTTKQKFWVHKSKTDKPKLVIHTRQLSNAVEDDLLIQMGEEIKNFLSIK